eukprot:g717.t1
MDTLEQTVLSVAKQLEEKVDDEISRLGNLNDKEIEALRKKRIEELKKRNAKKEEWIRAGHGEYSEVEEKNFFSEAKRSERLVCHFYRENWPCKVVDKHIGILCPKHIETKFVKVHAEKAPFLTEKLNVRVLPTLALIKNGKVDDYIVGFDELGGTDDFETHVLEDRLARSEVIFADETHMPSAKQETKSSTISKGLAFQKTASDEDSDFDD